MDNYLPDLGELILKEQLRQWYIWKDSGTSKYLSYMDEFDQFCTTNWLSSKNCG